VMLMVNETDLGRAFLTLVILWDSEMVWKTDCLLVQRQLADK